MLEETRDLIFVSYSHRDKAWLEKLLIFLKPYQRKGQLTVWADPNIEVGDVWKREIDHALPRANVGLLLISPYFLASDFIMDHEVPPLEVAAETGHMHMFCVPISSGPVEPPYGVGQLLCNRSHRSVDNIWGRGSVAHSLESHNGQSGTHIKRPHGNGQILCN